MQGQKDPQQMEQTIFMRAKTGEDYLNCIARFILMIQNQRNNAQGGSNVGPSGGQVIQDQGSSGNMLPQFPINMQMRQMIPGASHAPPTYPGGPSPGIPSMS